MHVTKKTSLKIPKNEFGKQWQKVLPLAILNYNKTYHSGIGCEPSRSFHGQVSYKIFDQKLGLKIKTGFFRTTHFEDELLRKTQILYKKTKKK